MTSILEAVLRKLARLLFVIFRSYFNVLEEFSRAIVSDYERPPYIKSLIADLDPTESSASVDDRIKKIDAARENLQDAIAAIEELRLQADTNKRDLEDALRRIEDADRQKAELSRELATLKQVAEADTEAFRKIVGLPTRTDIWRERILGFIGGVLASILASVLIHRTSMIFKAT